MGMAAILVMWPRCPEQTFVPPIHGGSTWNLVMIGPVVLEKIFENGGRMDNGRTMDGQWTDDGACLYYKLTNEPKGSEELKMHTHTWCFYSQTKKLQASETGTVELQRKLMEKRKSSKSWYFSLVKYHFQYFSLVKISHFEICILFHQYSSVCYYFVYNKNIFVHVCIKIHIVTKIHCRNVPFFCIMLESKFTVIKQYFTICPSTPCANQQ